MRIPPEHRQRYWLRTRQVTLLLLAIWFAVTFLSIWYARELTGLTLLGWPVSFYMAAQGSVLVYVAIIGAYAWWMGRLDAKYQVRANDGEE